MKELEILQLATEKLTLLTGVVIKDLDLDVGGKEEGYNAEIEIRTAKNHVRFMVETKNELRNKNISLTSGINAQTDRSISLLHNIFPNRSSRN